jgi:hypothetical protein
VPGQYHRPGNASTRAVWPQGLRSTAGLDQFRVDGGERLGPFAFAYLTQEFGGWISFAAMTAILGAAIVFSTLIPDARKTQRSPSHDTA